MTVKKQMVTYLFGLGLFLLLFVSSAEANRLLTVQWEGKSINMKGETPYVTKENRAIVPIRAVFEEMGYYEEQDKTVTLKNKDHHFVFYLQKKRYQWNGKTYKTDQLPTIRNDRVYIPVRYWSEKTGVHVRYEKAAHVVHLTKSTQETKPKPPVVDLPVEKPLEKPPTIEEPVVLNHNEIKLPDKQKEGCYLVETIGQLQAMREDMNGCYELVTDIDATYTENWNDGKGFEPIGTESSPFSGTINGNGYTVTGLLINRPTEDYVGLVNSNGAVIIDIHFKQARITGNQTPEAIASFIPNTFEKTSGVLAGFAVQTLITDSSVTDSVVNAMNAGGIIGVASESEIVNSYASDIQSNGSYTGGFVAFAVNDTKLKKIRVTRIQTNGIDYSGGIYAYGNNITVSDVTVNDNVIVSTRYAGGMAGMSYLGKYTDINVRNTKVRSTTSGGVFAFTRGHSRI